MQRGCLVKTDEGYFGIIKTVRNDTATVFLSNGLVEDLPVDALVGLPMRDRNGASESELREREHEAVDACFVEILDGYEAMERLRLESDQQGCRVHRVLGDAPCGGIVPGIGDA